VERLKSGTWKGFGTQFDAMRELLEEMNRQSTGDQYPKSLIGETSFEAF
jgi:hypothetical protein